jgi:ribosome-associated toxin RatA of RatAB toxin-antitoxin module
MPTRSRLRSLAASAAFAPLALALALPAGLAAGISPSWTSSHKQRLAAGGVPVFHPGQDPAAGARLAAAIHVDASREDVWAVISNPGAQPEFLPGVKRSDVTQISSRSQLVDHRVKVGILPMTLSYRYRTQQTPLQRIDFARVSGEVRAFEGRWLLFDAPDLIGKPGTVVFYELYIDPGNGIPQKMVKQNLQKDMPDMLAKVRQRVYTVRGRA